MTGIETESVDIAMTATTAIESVIGRDQIGMIVGTGCEMDIGTGNATTEIERGTETSGMIDAVDVTTMRLPLPNPCLRTVIVDPDTRRSHSLRLCGDMIILRLDHRVLRG